MPSRALRPSILSTPPARPDSAQHMPHTILSLQNVSVSRGREPVLHDIDLRLDAGEHLAILGPNGCGKSTLLKTITGEFYPLTVSRNGRRSSVSIFGRPRWDLAELRQRLGVVSPDLPGQPTLQTSGIDAILTGFFSASTLWPNLAVTEGMRSRAEDLLHQVGGEALRHKPVGEMSAGEQRRILIARALAGSRAAAHLQQLAAQTPPSATPGAAQTPPPPSVVLSAAQTPPPKDLHSDPPPPLSEAQSAPPQDLYPDPPPTTEMLLLDEPSNALDLSAQRDLRNLLRDLARQGTTILLITHHTADIIPEIDRILLMSNGRIIADGPKRDLLTASTLSSLFRTDITLTERDGFFHAW